VQGFPSLQFKEIPGTHTLFTQVSAPVQMLLSSQSACVSQQPGGGDPAVQTPVWHDSAPLQATPSGQGVPFGSLFALQTPDPLQVSGLSQLVSALLPQDVPEATLPC